MRRKIGDLLGRLLCFVGVHDLRVIEVIFGFGIDDTVEKVQCQRCGLVTTRKG